MATRSALLSCTVCRVCVHSSCYGVGVLQTSTTNGGDTANGGYCNTWLCRRCEQREEAAKCCLCLQRGGALKPTSDGRWAHISCALCLSEVSFGQPAAREPIIVSQVSPKDSEPTSSSPTGSIVTQLFWHCRWDAEERSYPTVFTAMNGRGKEWAAQVVSSTKESV